MSSDLLTPEQELREAVERIGSVDTLIRVLSWDAFNLLIQKRLDFAYPESVFPWQQIQAGVMWNSEQAGEDIDPGVKWVALLRMALDIVKHPEEGASK